MSIDETSNIEVSENTVVEDTAEGDCDADVQSFGDDQSAKKCFFCEKINIKRKGRQIYCRKIKNKIPFLEKIKNDATELGDIEILQKIQEENNSDSSLAYHNNCSVTYFAKYQRKINPPPTDDWATKRDGHKLARERLINYIQQEVITNRQVMSLAHLKYCYAEFVKEIYEHANLEATTFSTQAIKDYIQTQLKHKVSLVNISNKQFFISSEIDIETIDDEKIQDILFEQEVKDFALKYRKNILKIKKKTFNRFYRQ